MAKGTADRGNSSKYVAIAASLSFTRRYGMQGLAKKCDENGPVSGTVRRSGQPQRGPFCVGRAFAEESKRAAVREGDVVKDGRQE